MRTRKVPTSLSALKWLPRSPCQRCSTASLGGCQPLNHAQGFSVSKQEQGIILVGRAVLRKSRSLALSRPYSPYAVFAGTTRALVRGSVCAVGSGTLASDIILSRGLLHSAAASRIN